MSYAMDRKAPLALAVLFALPVLACEQAPTETLVADGPQAAVVNQPGNGVAEAEKFEICKHGSDASFTVDIVDQGPSGTANISTSVSLTDGQCADVWISGGAYVDQITVTEDPVPGYTASWVLDQLDNHVVTQTSGSGATVVGYTSGVTNGSPNLAGALVVFTNTEIPGGGEGCTPGYWKQEQHFSEWTGYSPGDVFDAVFGVAAFGPMTLVEVASQGGGGLNALGRHAVAALLNAASAGVDYAWTEQEVKDAFAAALASGDYNAQKDLFETENEYGAPICE